MKDNLIIVEIKLDEWVFLTCILISIDPTKYLFLVLQMLYHVLDFVCYALQLAPTYLFDHRSTLCNILVYHVNIIVEELVILNSLLYQSISLYTLFSAALAILLGTNPLLQFIVGLWVETISLTTTPHTRVHRMVANLGLIRWCCALFFHFKFLCGIII